MIVHPPSMGIALVLFDMDGVLVDVDKPARAAWLGALAGRPAEDVQRDLWGSGFDDQGDDGRLRGQVYLDAFGRVLGYPLSLGEWAEARRIATRPKRAVLDLAARLHPSVRRAVLTNNADVLPAQMPVICPPVAALFGKNVFSTGAFGGAKPDPAVFHACLAALGIAPQQALFIDDKEQHAEGARRAGLRAAVFSTADALEAELNRHGILQPV